MRVTPRALPTHLQSGTVGRGHATVVTVAATDVRLRERNCAWQRLPGGTARYGTATWSPAQQELLDAIVQLDAPRLQTLLAQGLSPDPPDSTRTDTLLGLALAWEQYMSPTGSWEVMQALLQAQPDLGAARLYGQPLLFHAVYAAQAEVAELLLAAGADVEAVDRAGDPLLHRAIRSVCHDYRFGPLMDPRTRPIALPAAWPDAAAMVPLLRVLLAHLDSPDTARDLQGQTALHRAGGCAPLSESERRRLVMVLLEHGAQVTTVDAAGATPLHAAVRAGTHGPDTGEVVSLLLTRGAQIEAQDLQGRTPLFAAAQANLPGAVTALLQQGADPTRATHAGDTPLSVSVELGHIQVSELLRRRL